jgi:L-fucose isomerase-like protein
MRSDVTTGRVVLVRMCVAQKWMQESESEVERSSERAETKCVLEECIGKSTGRERRG